MLRSTKCKFGKIGGMILSGINAGSVGVGFLHLLFHPHPSYWWYILIPFCAWASIIAWNSTKIWELNYQYWKKWEAEALAEMKKIYKEIIKNKQK